MNDLISIIVPIYNVEKYLNKCIESLIHQTYKKLEIILVDDGSPDNCGKICDEYAKIDNRIKVIHKKNGGLSDARNVGIDNSTGVYLSFIDSDDYISEEFIETLYKLCYNNNADISMCKFQRFTDYSKISNDIFKESIKIENKKSVLEDFCITNDINYIVVWNKLYKRYLFKNIRFPVGKINEDEFTTYKLFWNLKNDIAITDKELYYYRQNQNSIMGKKFNINRYIYLEALEERMVFFKEKKEEYLYERTALLYVNTIIEFYGLTLKYLEKSKDNQKELFKKFKKNYKEIIIFKISSKEKLKIKLFRYFPKIISNLLILKNNI